MPYNLPFIRQLDQDLAIYYNENGSVAVPIVRNMLFFNEADFFSEKLVSAHCHSLLEATAGSEKAYENFVRQKARRPAYDIYACFQSFNEAFKAFFPFIKILQKKLAPGDVILNLWDRTGWPAALLQGFFPQQRVITLWEGDKDVLGYKGFYFWYKELVAKKKMEVAFADLNKPLPFADGSIALVFGLDAFHRFDQSLLLHELLRITTDRSALIFPHVHLSNSEPEPFFERGCRQLHGLDYDAYFQQLFAHTGRQGFVFPEPEMFAINELYEGKRYPIVSQPNSRHYNALLAILPKSWAEREKLEPYRFEDLAQPEHCHILANPLLQVDTARQRVWIDRSKYSDRIGYLLDRHPIYMEKLTKADGYELSETGVKVLYLAGQLYTVGEIAETLSVDMALLLPLLQDMQERDILQLVPVNRQQIRMQHYITTQEYVVPENQQTLRALWERALSHFSERIFLISELDDSEFTYADCQEIISRIQAKFGQENLQKGDRIVLLTANHFEAILTILAAVEMGLVAVPLEYKLPTSIVQLILEEVQAGMIFVDEHSAGAFGSLLSGRKAVQFDGTGANTSLPLFSDWLAEYEEGPAVTQTPLSPDDLAVILYTSGSTGVPKGVMLGHGQLVRSSRLVTECFHWTTEDRFFAVGEPDSMSGLRNTCFAPLEVGCAVVIPTAESKGNLFSLCESLGRRRATILGTTPALLAQMVAFERRVRADVLNLRQVICTGSALSATLRQSFHRSFGITILNYYGLTETTGICISESADSVNAEDTGIGRACNCLVQVVDDQGKLLSAGEAGELRIYSNNIMRGYYRRPELTAQVIRDGWFYTGDIASIAPDGTVTLLGRKKDIIKTPDGSLVYTSEMEVILESHNMVREAAILPVLEGEREKMASFVVWAGAEPAGQAAETELRRWVKSRIGERNIPVEFVWVEALPRNANGKVLKEMLRFGE